MEGTLKEKSFAELLATSSKDHVELSVVEKFIAAWLLLFPQLLVPPRGISKCGEVYIVSDPRHKCMV